MLASLGDLPELEVDGLDRNCGVDERKHMTNPRYEITMTAQDSLY